nr:DNA mismatch repair protein MutS [uncultured Oribacterium sp.]
MDEAKLSPMMRQYLESKKEVPDALLFYRIGDFYEMFFEDAIKASKALDLVLTGKDCGLEERAPMCGIPYHAADSYVSKLVSQGFKVAIGEQVEDPKLAKGLVKREIIRVITPGTQTEETALEEGKNNYLSAIYPGNSGIGLATVDISTGELYSLSVSDSKELLDEISRFSPKEILCPIDFLEDKELRSALDSRFSLSITEKEKEYFGKEEADKILSTHFSSSIPGLGLEHAPLERRALGACLRYLYDTQKNILSHIRHIERFHREDYMLLDLSTQRNLELWETLRDKKKRGSLLWVLDKTHTAMGSRMLRHFLERPLRERKKMEERLDCIEELCQRYIDGEELREYLDSIYDMERLIGKISISSANARDMLALKSSLQFLPAIKRTLISFSGRLLQGLGQEMDALEELYTRIDECIEEDPPLSIKEGGIIKSSFHEEVRLFREAGEHGKEWLNQLEEREREKSGIKNLKIKYNRIFGYCFEISKSYQGEIPDYFIRRQTLAQAERYTTLELQDLQNKILGAAENLQQLEYSLFVNLREELSRELGRMQKTAKEIAFLDACLSLAKVAMQEQYVRPKINEEGNLRIVDGRHPVVEKLLQDQSFVPNDAKLGKEEKIAIITGPNMAGKSTYMRQVALIVLMASIGSFVPAKQADIPICDRIFTRVGASDDLASGQSTFMVEMSEVSNILRNATENSLLILDEIGRGTSTFDGLSIAWAVVEYLAREIKAKTLFATHYHELSVLEGKLENVKNYCIAVSKEQGEIQFLRKIMPGGADESYGIDVAKLAGVPAPVLDRAREISAFLNEKDLSLQHLDFEEALEDNFEEVFPENPLKAGETGRKNSALELSKEEKEVLDCIRNDSFESMSPLEAINLLFSLKEKLR